jgi:opacity protein-like surface antigen
LGRADGVARRRIEGIVMAKLRALVLAGIGAVAGEWAKAADLPPAPSLPQLSPGEAEFSGWYLRGDAGAGLNATAPELRISPDPIAAGVADGFRSAAATEGFNATTLSPFGMVDIGAGYQFNGWLRADATLEYRAGAGLQSGAAAYSWQAPSQDAVSFHADASSFIGLLNGYVAPGVWYGLWPFLGAGIGFADNRLAGVSATAPGWNGHFAAGARTSIAWAAMAGVDYDLTANLKLELSYRYLSYGTVTTGGLDGCPALTDPISSRSRLASNDFRLGLLYLIGDAPRLPAPNLN